MKATGIVRRLDELGRVVIPIELRRTLEMEDRQEIEIYVEDDAIILKKFEKAVKQGLQKNQKTKNRGEIW